MQRLHICRDSCAARLSLVRRRRTALTHDFAQQRVGRRLGGDIEVTPQRLLAETVLAQRVRVTAEPHERGHQTAVRMFVTRLDLYQPLECTQQSRPIAGSGALSSHAFEHVDQLAPELLALVARPMVERQRMDFDGAEQLVTVAVDRTQQGARRFVAREFVQLPNVAGHQFFVQPHGLGIGTERVRRQDTP